MLFDAHFHLSMLPDAAEVLKELLQIDYHGESSACFPDFWETEENLLKNQTYILKTFGLHPQIIDIQTDIFKKLPKKSENIISESNLKNLAILEKILTRNPDAGVGECGLDKRFKGYEIGGEQESLFREQIYLAKKLKRRLVVHTVGDWMRSLKILKEENFPTSQKLYLHRFSGNKQIADYALRFFDVTFGNVTASVCSDFDRRVAETDADLNFINAHLTDQTPTKIVALLMQRLKENTQKFKQPTP